jgi:hypothetical protein
MIRRLLQPSVRLELIPHLTLKSDGEQNAKRDESWRLISRVMSVERVTR